MLNSDLTARRRPRWAALIVADLALIAEAVADAFRALVPSRPETRWSRLRHCGCSF